jgi:hypothetical protein
VTELSRILPSHPDEGGPFIIEETISVYAAAMAYRNRHPVSAHLRDAEIQDPEVVDLLERRIGRRAKRVPETLNEVGTEREETDQERNWRICWEVYCTFVAGINDGTIKPAHVALDPQGRIIPLACTIWTRDLLSLALQRGDAGKTITALAEANAASIRGAEALMSGLPEPPLALPPPPKLTPAPPIATGQSKPLRGHYIGILERFMLGFPPEASGWSDRAITDKFVAEWPSLGGEGKLPHKRYVEVQVEKLRKKIRRQTNLNNT